MGKPAGNHPLETSLSKNSRTAYYVLRKEKPGTKYAVRNTIPRRKHYSRHLHLFIILVGLLLPTLACELFSTEYGLNNQVRLAVYHHERETRGQTNDLVLQFNRTEPKVKFEGQQENDGRTVWLFDMAAKEYFELLPPERTFLYVQRAEYNRDYSAATVKVFRGNGSGYKGRELALTADGNGSWTIIEDNAIADSP